MSRKQTYPSDRLRDKGIEYLGCAGSERVIGQLGAELIAFTQDGSTELWRHPLPTKEAGFVYADVRTIFWNAREPRGFIAVRPADGRQLYAFDGEWAVWPDGDRFLSRNAEGTGFLRRSENGEVIFTLRGLSGDVGYKLSPDGRLLINGCWPAQVWDLNDGKLRLSFNTSSTAEYEWAQDKLVVKTIMTPQSGMQDEITVQTYDLSTWSLIDEKSWWERQGP